jgi:hypothetical protein
MRVDIPARRYVQFLCKVFSPYPRPEPLKKLFATPRHKPSKNLGAFGFATPVDDSEHPYRDVEHRNTQFTMPNKEEYEISLETNVPEDINFRRGAESSEQEVEVEPYAFLTRQRTLVNTRLILRPMHYRIIDSF